MRCLHWFDMISSLTRRWQSVRYQNIFKKFIYCCLSFITYIWLPNRWTEQRININRTTNRNAFQWYYYILSPVFTIVRRQFYQIWNPKVKHSCAQRMKYEYKKVRRPSESIYSTSYQICWPNYLWFYYIVSADAWANWYLRAILFYSIEFCVHHFRAKSIKCSVFGCLYCVYYYYYFAIYSNWIDCPKHLRNWCIPAGAEKIVTNFCYHSSWWKQINVQKPGFEWISHKCKMNGKENE